MRAMELLVVYLLVGGGVSLAWGRRHGSGRLWVLPLWPIFLPSLLVAAPPLASSEAAGVVPQVHGPWGARIAQAVATLQQALGSWEALPDRGVCEQSLRAAERGLNALADRHGQLESVLSAPENRSDALALALSQGPTPGHEVLSARLENLRRLESLRDDAAQELERALAGMADLATRVHLARFTGDAAQELAGQLARLADAVDGASEVSRLGSPRAVSQRSPGPARPAAPPRHSAATGSG